MDTLVLLLPRLTPWRLSKGWMPVSNFPLWCYIHPVNTHHIHREAGMGTHTCGGICLQVSEGPHCLSVFLPWLTLSGMNIF